MSEESRKTETAASAVVNPAGGKATVNSVGTAGAKATANPAGASAAKAAGTKPDSTKTAAAKPAGAKPAAAKKKKKTDIKKIHAWVRAAIQLVFFLFLPSVYSSAFAGVKYIFNQFSSVSSIELTSFVTVLIVICLYTLVFGRFFCGFACAFGSLGDFFRWLYLTIVKKRKKKPVKFPQKLEKILPFGKYLVLLVIVVLCFFGKFDTVQSASPWTVFSMLHNFNFSLGRYIPGLVILLLIVIGMCLEDRFFCRFLCPMGAVFTLVPVLPIFGLVRERDNCIKGCSACTKKCPSNIELPQKGKYDVSADCFQCQKCIDTCPKKNVHTGIKKLRGNEIWFTLLRAALLFAICKGIGL